MKLLTPLFRRQAPVLCALPVLHGNKVISCRAFSARNMSSGGRGEYYKRKYGGGGRGDTNGGRKKNNHANAPRATGNNGGTLDKLHNELLRIDGRSYPAYRSIESESFGWMAPPPCATPLALYIGRAQADSYAPPTRCRVEIVPKTHGFPAEFYNNPVRAVALADYLHRTFYTSCRERRADQASGGGGWSGAKGGDIQIQAPTQHVLETSAVTVSPSTGNIAAQFTVNLPAKGRTVLGQQAADIFTRVVPALVETALTNQNIDIEQLKHHIDSVEDQEWVRQQLDAAGLVAFVPDGAVLPRATGADDRPLRGDHVVPFTAPPSLRVSFTLPNAQRTIQGMGIRKGVSLIAGGGFHGKSTLLTALQVGVYNKLPNDGREYCVTDPNAVKIRAEDGRAVSSVDISPFINNLPFGKDTVSFSTEDASGSTSQASNIVEALEVGATTLLIDEDTCATNFMIRDDKMMELVAKEKEPITPFIHKIRSLYEDKGVSSILVIGGSGDYFDVADCVIMMDSYQCMDVTTRAKEIAAAGASHVASSSEPFGSVVARCPVSKAYQPDGKVAVRAKNVISYGNVELDLAGLEQIVSVSQTNAISMALQRVVDRANKSNTVAEILAMIDSMIDKKGLDSLAPGIFHGGLARPRLFEIAGAVNRLRTADNMVQKK